VEPITKFFQVIVKLLVSGIIFVLMILAAVVAINGYMYISVKNDIVPPDSLKKGQADCILVLGAGVWGKKPSPMLEDRLKTGIDLYKKSVSDRIIISGDHGQDNYDEVNVMKQFAVERGVPSEHIFMDHAGFSTYESMYRARDVFKVQKMVVVTQKYHLYRALYVAKGLGLQAKGVIADKRAYAGQSYRNLREWVARVKDFFYTLVKPLPTYLGDAIPVKGNGDATNDNSPLLVDP